MTLPYYLSRSVAHTKAEANPPCPRFAKGGRLSRRLARGLHLVGAIFVFLFLFSPSHASDITEYRVIRQPVSDAAGRVRVAIRSFQADGGARMLVVDPTTFATAVVPASDLHPLAQADARLRSTPYLKALERYTSPPFRLQNAGLTHAETAPDGVFLTVDLCPSKRQFEREMFEAAESLRKGGAVPVGVAISGVWLVSHPEELAWLKREVAAGKLAITWINHSYHHPYEPKVPLAENFLLTKGTDFDAEVLDVEKRLLAAGVVPSPFFRFPGLVSDQGTITRLRELSLIPIGSNAWLAKGETPVKGSVILVHGNGNEPKGIKLLLPMLKNKELNLLPLPMAFKN